MEDVIMAAPRPPSPADLIRSECDAIRDMLLAKNARYGNAALEPLGIAAKGVSAEAGIRVRIDDKLKRWQALPDGDDEDTVADLIGYLVLLRVHRRMGRDQPPSGCASDAVKVGNATYFVRRETKP